MNTQISLTRREALFATKSVAALGTQDRRLDRRRILLGGIMLVAAFALSAGGPAQAQQTVPAQPVGRLPKTYKVHLDGYNQLPYLSGQSQASARREFFYYGESLAALLAALHRGAEQ